MTVPEVENGNTTVLSVIRTFMYAIAPAKLWQFFSAQGKCGTERRSFVGEMPHIYRAILSAAVARCNSNSTTVISAISAVTRSCQTRVESLKYRAEHPELLRATQALPEVTEETEASELENNLSQNI